MKHIGPIAGIASQGHWVATAGYDNQVILWDGRRKAPLARGCHDHLVNHCAFSPDGRWLLSASSDYSVRLWSVPDMRLQTVLPGHSDDVDMALFSPDGRRIATCALDRCVRVFDLQGRCRHEMHGHEGHVLSLAWSTDSRTLVSSSVDGSLRRWNAATGEAEGVTLLQVRTDSVEMTAEGVLYAGDDRGRIARVDGHAFETFDAHRAGVKKIVLDAARQRLATLSYDRSIALWTLDTAGRPTLASRTEMPATVWARAAALLPDGRLACGTFGGGYAVFDPASSQWDLDEVGAGPAINAVLQDDGRVVTVGDAGRVRIDGRPVAETGSLCNFLVRCGLHLYTGGQLGTIFDAETGKPLYQHHSPLNCAASFEREGRRHLAVGTYTGEVLLLRQEGAGALVRAQTLQVYANAVKGLQADDGVLFSVCASSDVAWHTLDDGRLLRYQARAHDRIANACCSLGGRRFASVSRDRKLRIWDAQGVESFDTPHPNSVKCLCANDEGTAILSGSYGGTVALFDIATRTWTRFERPTAAGISCIAWDPRARRFLAASYDGGIYPVAA